jgi:hypothetical protein
MAKGRKSRSGSRRAEDRKQLTAIRDTPDEFQKARNRIPAPMSGGTDDHEWVAKLLSEKLGLHEELPAIHRKDRNDAKGDVESE